MFPGAVVVQRRPGDAPSRVRSLFCPGGRLPQRAMGAAEQVGFGEATAFEERLGARPVRRGAAVGGAEQGQVFAGQGVRGLAAREHQRQRLERFHCRADDHREGGVAGRLQEGSAGRDDGDRPRVPGLVRRAAADRGEPAERRLRPARQRGRPPESRRSGTGCRAERPAKGVARARTERRESGGGGPR